jgi:hypothetical protein
VEAIKRASRPLVKFERYEARQNKAGFTYLGVPQGRLSTTERFILSGSRKGCDGYEQNDPEISEVKKIEPDSVVAETGSGDNRMREGPIRLPGNAAIVRIMVGQVNSRPPIP